MYLNPERSYIRTVTLNTFTQPDSVYAYNRSTCIQRFIEIYIIMIKVIII